LAISPTNLLQQTFRAHRPSCAPRSAQAHKVSRATWSRPCHTSQHAPCTQRIRLSSFSALTGFSAHYRTSNSSTPSLTCATANAGPRPTSRATSPTRRHGSMHPTTSLASSSSSTESSETKRRLLCSAPRQSWSLFLQDQSSRDLLGANEPSPNPHAIFLSYHLYNILRAFVS
jgi:hypothetical protein